MPDAVSGDASRTLVSASYDAEDRSHVRGKRRKLAILPGVGSAR